VWLSVHFFGCDKTEHQIRKRLELVILYLVYEVKTFPMKLYFLNLVLPHITSFEIALIVIDEANASRDLT